MESALLQGSVEYFHEPRSVSSNSSRNQHPILEEAQKAQIIKVNLPRNVLPNDYGLAECIKVCERTKWHRI